MKSLQEEYERIQKYVDKIDTENYKLYLSEANAIYTCSEGVLEMILTAFKFGFAKGCRKNKKAVKS